MKILLISQWFDPEPTFKGLAFARQLINDGHQVTVITGFPNYPGGKVYQGYKIRPVQHEQIDGINIYRVALYPSHDKSALGRVFNYLSFAFTALIMALIKVWKHDVVYAYHPPLTVGMAAGIASRIAAKPLVYDIQDLWPDTLAATGMINNAKALKVVGFFCQLTYKMASALVVLSPGFKKLLIERGVPSHKIRVIPNWCDERALQQPSAKQPSLLPTQQFNIVFAGNMGPAQALHVILEAAKSLANTHPHIQFHLIGDGISKADLQQQAQKLALTNVCFHPRVPMTQIGAYLQSAHALLVHLRDDPLFSITIPSKTQAYMAMAKPVIMAVKGDAADIIEQSGGGIVALPENAQDIAQQIANLAGLTDAQLQHMGQEAYRYYQRELSLAVGVQQFEHVFAALIKK